MDSLDDMETLFSGIPLGEVSTSMTINSTAAMALAFYVCVAEQQGVPRAELRGTIQTDILKEYIAQKEWIFPPEPSMRLVVDMIEFCAEEMRAGTPCRSPGTTSARRARTRRRSSRSRSPTGSHTSRRPWRVARRRRLAPRLSFFFNAHLDFFEEIAKYRRLAGSGLVAAGAIRRTQPRSWLMRFHTQTAGVSLTAQQPEGEHRPHGARGDVGGARGHPVAAHELVRRGARAPDRARGADRAPHAAVIAHETGVVNTIDPLGGSWYVEDPDEPPRGGVRLLRSDRQARRRDPGDQGELLPA